MSRKRIGIILAVLGALLAGIAGVYVYMQLTEAEEIARLNPAKNVVVAVRDLPERVKVPEDAVEIMKVPAAMVPDQAALTVEEVVGKYPLAPLYKNEVITKPKLANTLGPAAPSFALKEGMVAIGIAGNDLLTGAGAIRAGDHVDMILTVPIVTGQPLTEIVITDPDELVNPSPLTTQKLLQNLEVLRVGTFPATNAQGDKVETKGVVTVQASHQDALIVTWAQDMGAKLSLALRHPSDKEPVETGAITADYVFRKFKFMPADALQP